MLTRTLVLTVIVCQFIHFARTEETPGELDKEKPFLSGSNVGSQGKGTSFDTDSKRLLDLLAHMCDCVKKTHSEAIKKDVISFAAKTAKDLAKQRQENVQLKSNENETGSESSESKPDKSSQIMHLKSVLKKLREINAEALSHAADTKDAAQSETASMKPEPAAEQDQSNESAAREAAEFVTRDETKDKNPTTEKGLHHSKLFNNLKQAAKKKSNTVDESKEMPKHLEPSTDESDLYDSDSDTDTLHRAESAERADHSSDLERKPEPVMPKEEEARIEKAARTAADVIINEYKNKKMKRQKSRGEQEKLIEEAAKTAADLVKKEYETGKEIQQGEQRSTETKTEGGEISSDGTDLSESHPKEYDPVPDSSDEAAQMLTPHHLEHPVVEQEEKILNPMKELNDAVKPAEVEEQTSKNEKRTEDTSANQARDQEISTLLKRLAELERERKERDELKVVEKPASATIKLHESKVQEPKVDGERKEPESPRVNDTPAPATIKLQQNQVQEPVKKPLVMPPATNETAIEKREPRNPPKPVEIIKSQQVVSTTPKVSKSPQDVKTETGTKPAESGPSLKTLTGLQGVLTPPAVVKQLGNSRIMIYGKYNSSTVSAVYDKYHPHKEGNTFIFFCS